MMYSTADSLSTRRAECARLRARYPGMLPIAVESAVKGSKARLLALPACATVLELKGRICDAAGMPPAKPLSLSVDNCTPSAAVTVGDLFDECAQEDGFLHVVCANEHVMGGMPPGAGMGCFSIGLDCSGLCSNSDDC